MELEGLTLDHSYASIDPVEERFAESLAKSEALALPVEGYLGDTLVERTGGVLGRGRDRLLADRWTVHFPNEVEFSPKDVVNQFIIFVEQDSRMLGYLRDETERHDLALRRAELEALLADKRAALDELAERARVTSSGDPGAALDGLERALAASTTMPIAAHRLLLRGVTLFAGELVHEKKPSAAWRVQDKPKANDYGHWLVGTWAVSQVIRNCLYEPPGTLRKRVRAAVDR